MFKLELTREELSFIGQVLAKVNVNIDGARTLLSLVEKINLLVPAIQPEQKEGQ